MPFVVCGPAPARSDGFAAAFDAGFRADLFHRPNVVTVRIPPLAAALRQYAPAHDWPGDVRELMHVAERVAWGKWRGGRRRGRSGQPAAAHGTLPGLIREALARHRGEVKPTLQALAIPRKTFYDKLQRHGMDRSEFQPRDGA